MRAENPSYTPGATMISALSWRNFRSLVAVVIGGVAYSCVGCVGCVADIVNMVYAVKL